MRIIALLIGLLAVAVATVGCFGASCKPQEIHGVHMNCGGGAKGFMWTGTSCIFTMACACTGPDCQRLYSTQDACEAAHYHCR